MAKQPPTCSPPKVHPLGTRLSTSAPDARSRLTSSTRLWLHAKNSECPISVAVSISRRRRVARRRPSSAVLYRTGRLGQDERLLRRSVGGTVNLPAARSKERTRKWGRFGACATPRAHGGQRLFARRVGRVVCSVRGRWNVPWRATCVAIERNYKARSGRCQRAGLSAAGRAAKARKNH